MREYYYRDLELLEKFITSGKKTLIITSDNLDEVKKIKSHRYGCVVLENAVGDIEDIQKFLNKIRKELGADKPLDCTTTIDQRLMPDVISNCPTKSRNQARLFRQYCHPGKK